jgi:hypothetical protein
MFPYFLTHQSGKDIVSEFPGASDYAQSVGKPFLMFETNTASCGGFPGLSDSFGAALWGIDYALQLAYSNFSTVLFHVGGQSVYYNVCSTINLVVQHLIIVLFSPSRVCIHCSTLMKIVLTIFFSTCNKPVSIPSVDDWYMLSCHFSVENLQRPSQVRSITQP